MQLIQHKDAYDFNHRVHMGVILTHFGTCCTTMRQLGNAVPVALAEMIASSTRGHLLRVKAIQV